MLPADDTATQPPPFRLAHPSHQFFLFVSTLGLGLNIRFATQLLTRHHPILSKGLRLTHTSNTPILKVFVSQFMCVLVLRRRLAVLAAGFTASSHEQTEYASVLCKGAITERLDDNDDMEVCDVVALR